MVLKAKVMSPKVSRGAPITGILVKAAWVSSAQACEGADNYGIPKGARTGDERLSHGIAGLRRRCHDGRASQTTLIREESAGDAIAGCQHDRTPCKARAGGLRAEGGFAYQLQCRPDIGVVDAEDVKAARHVEDCHQGDEHGAHAGNALYAAEHHRRGQQTEYHACGDGRQAKGLVDERGDGVGLDGVADAEGRDGGEDGEEYACPPPAQPALQCVHGTAEHLAAWSLHSVFDGQERFSIFGGDTEYAREPAPEYGARASQGYRRGYTHYVARADGGGKGCGQRTELRHVAR